MWPVSLLAIQDDASLPAEDVATKKNPWGHCFQNEIDFLLSGVRWANIGYRIYNLSQIIYKYKYQILFRNQFRIVIWYKIRISV